MTEPPPLPPRNSLMTLLMGMGVANLVGGLLWYGVAWLSDVWKGPNAGTIMYPSFILLPLWSIRALVGVNGGSLLSILVSRLYGAPRS